VRTPEFFLGLDYAVANLRLGLGGLYYAFREGPESQQISLFRNEFASLDRNVTEGWLFFEYNNGRLKLGTEFDFYYSTTRHQGSQSGWVYTGNGNAVQDNPAVNGQSFFAPDYVESWRFMTTCGLYIGPSRISLFYSYIPGPDRRHGILIHKQPTISTPNRKASRVFRPYSLILGPLYSAGTGNGNSDIHDASVIAAAYDYAVAANLNIGISALHARRLSHGYGWGYMRPRIPNEDFPSIQFGTVETLRRGSYTNPAPAIPDDDLGWEFTGVLKWQLLQDWLFQARVGYWVPGKWFSYACTDKAVNQPTNWDMMTNAATAQYPFGINPNRHIDPVFALDISSVYNW
jgi:hypothetical protein